MAKQKATVLLIENNSADPQALSKLIELGINSHFSVETTNLLNIGLSRLKSSDFDMVLLDLPLETHKGLDAIRFIKEHAVSVPIFVV